MMDPAMNGASAVVVRRNPLFVIGYSIGVSARILQLFEAPSQHYMQQHVQQTIYW